MRDERRAVRRLAGFWRYLNVSRILRSVKFIGRGPAAAPSTAP
jgi:hypothetical protein